MSLSPIIDENAGHVSSINAADKQTTGLPEQPAVQDDVLLERAHTLSSAWQMLPPASYETGLPQRILQLSARLKSTLQLALDRVQGKDLTPQLELLEGTRMLEAVITSSSSAADALSALPQVRLIHDDALPRITSLAEAYLDSAQGIWSPASLSLFVGGVQQHHALLLAEVLLLPQALKMAQLEYVLDRAQEMFSSSEAIPGIEHSPFSAPIHSLRRLNQFEWRGLLEALVSFDATLRQDPADAFGAMEDETRNAYHVRVAELAKNADQNELQTAATALQLAHQAKRSSAADPRLAERKSHIGYYLFAEGLAELKQRIGYHAPPAERLRDFLRRYNEDFYIVGIISLSIVLIVPIIAPLVPRNEFWPVIGALLLAIIPVTQGAVDLVNGLVSSVLKAESLPKLDLSKSIPASASTLVVIPTLLLHERQVRELFEDLEARYLSNEDPNLHFALLTDLPDTAAEPGPEADARHPLVQMALQFTENLNAKYANSRSRGGRFLLLHRSRVFNARQGVWMGWERKRGKLLDLNKFLLHEYDSFPIKSGPLDVLQAIRYVITLDSDTQLPRGTAARLIGTIAHPLNRAIIDPQRRIVTAGYGILQPRVGVSVASASRSRLSAIYSGETGFDIYTRAVSDVYQDLFGEGIFTGKGIYEVSILHQVLERRFPRNALLSHDLIEGAYVRAGLVTDIEVIDDYPSQYHAHTRRKHRWIRGDWQIMRWLFSPVPDESGRQVSNPISLISQWKIVDNLRRSLVEPFTFLVLVCGWFFLPGGAFYWTLVTITLLLLPKLMQLLVDLAQAVIKVNFIAARGAFVAFLNSTAFSLLNLTFLAHQMLLSVDAIIRTLNRNFLSGERLLEWETAAQSESARTRNSLDVYLQLSPVIALVLGAGLFLSTRSSDPKAIYDAAPILLLWIAAPFVAAWLNSAPKAAEGPLSAADRGFLEHHALLLWRFYAEFGGSTNHWLIPDNVEEKGLLQVRKLSPTNLGMLLNARQAATELGFLSLPEFTEATLGTLETYAGLEKHRGHIFNWYDIETLRPVAPYTVSAVDSGNLAASLYTLHSGTLDLLKRSMLTLQTFAALDGFAAPGGSSQIVTTPLMERVAGLFKSSIEASPIGDLDTASEPLSALRWIEREALRRRHALAEMIEAYLPWMLPQYASIPKIAALNPQLVPDPEHLDVYMRSVLEALDAPGSNGSSAELIESLRARLGVALERAQQLQRDLKSIVDRSEEFAEQMEYGFLFVESRQLLSIGYDGQTHELHSACYDLLASEARIASFLAVAKGDIPQQAWFRLDRGHVLVNGRAALMSWTGTMFEYMMPALWMRSFPNTLLSNSLESAVRIQVEHVKKIPWGISESGFATTDPQGRYGYQAWGIPKLALKYGAEDGPVISPYSTFLALPLLRGEAITNLRRMEKLGWTGDFGFYEAADYTTELLAGNKEQGPSSESPSPVRSNARSYNRNQPRIVRSWMAHHQGMALLAVTNLLRQNIIQTWFHANPRVRAAELLLHEKALSKETLSALAKRGDAV